MKQLICAADIEALKQAGKTVCVTGPDVIVTPSAKDAAEALGITFSDKEPEKAACTCDGEGIDSEAFKSSDGQGTFRRTADKMWQPPLSVRNP